MKIAKNKLFKIILGSFVLAAVFLPSVAVAEEEPTWGPARTTYTMEHPASEPVFNSITDNPTITDERKFVRIARIPETCGDDCDIVNIDFKQSVELEPNATYMVYIYYHNNASSSLNNASGTGVAKNATLYSSFPDRIIGERGEVEAKISWNKYQDASGTEPSTVWSKAYFANNTNKDIALRYVVGSAKHYNAGVEDANGKIIPAVNTSTGLKTHTEAVSDKLFDDDEGVLLGFGDLAVGGYNYSFGSGIVFGCEPYHGIVTYVLKTYEVNATVNKQVSVDGGRTYTETANILPGDTVKFKITVTNTGTTDITNPVLKDILPEGLTLVGKPTIVAEGESAELGTGLNYNLGEKIAAGRSIDLIFDAKAGTNFGCVGTELINKAKLTYDGITTEGVVKEDEAKVIVKKSDEECRGKTYAAEIVKEVSLDGGKTYSETAVITPGATVRYRLTIRNTGDTDLNGLQVKDKLPTGMTLVPGSEKNTIEGAFLWADLDDSLEHVFNIATDVTMYIAYDAVADGKDFDCDGTDLINTAEILYDDGSTKEGTTKTAHAKVTVKKSDEECRKKNYKAEIKKEISVDGGKTYSETAKIAPGATVRYRLTVSNTGDTNITGLQVKDKLPAGMTLVKDSEKNTVEGATEWKALDGTLDHAFNMLTGQVMYIVYDAVADDGDFNCLGTDLINTAKIIYNNGKDEVTKTDESTVTVTKEAKDCKYEALVTKEISIDNGKTYLAEATVVPGSTVRYRLIINNTGSEDLTGIDVKDELPKGLTLVKGSVKVSTKGSDEEAEFDDTLEYKLSAVAAGQTVYIIYDAKAGTDFDCTGKELVNTAKISYVDEDSKEGTTKTDQAKVTVKKSADECKTCKTDPDMEGCKELPNTGPMEITIFSIIMAGIVGGSVYLILANRTLRRVTANVMNEDAAKDAPAENTVQPIAPAEPMNDGKDKTDGGALNA